MKRSFFMYLAVLLAIGLLLSFALQRLDRVREPHSNAPLSGNLHFPQRVICTAPSIVETVYALGEDKRIIGVSDFAIYPPEVSQKEKIGGLMNPDIEKILSLHPDLMIMQGGMEKYVDLCREKKIEYLRVDMENLQSIFAGIRAIGTALGCSRKADALVESIQSDLKKVQEKNRAQSHSPTVFLCLSRRMGSLSGLYTLSRQSFIAELLEVAGGTNIFDDAPGRYPQISKESLLMRNPDIILELRPDEATLAQSWQALRDDWKDMPSIHAVAEGRIDCVTDDFILIPGPRIARTAERFYELIHGYDDFRSFAY